MDREIKFRGRRVDNGEWVYGSYVFVNDDTPEGFRDYYYIVDESGRQFSIDPKTVGQFTGLHDNNGVEIYEGDIVGIPYVNPMGGCDDEWSYKAKVFFNFGCFWIDYEDEHHPVPQLILDWVERSKGKYIPNFGEPNIYKNKTRLEVIGNIHQSPELLEE